MNDFDSAELQILGSTIGLESVSVELPMNGGEQGQLEAFGIDDIDGAPFSLRAFKGGALVGVGSFNFANVLGPKSGADAPLSRTRQVSMQDFTALWDVPVGQREIIGLPPTPVRFQAVLYDLDKPLGSDLPTGEECEEERRSGRISVPAASAKALEVAGMDVRIIPGPGFVTRDLDDAYSTKGKTISQVLSELLFTNGVRWWLEGDLVVVDGRALPVGRFTVPAHDEEDVGENTFEDDQADYEAAPVLSDYIARCAENSLTDSGEEGTFETKPDAELLEVELSGVQGPDGDYARTETRTIKRNWQITKVTSISFGYVTTPTARVIGRTQQTTLDNEHHPSVPTALIGTVERTYTYADYGLLQTLEGAGQGQSELQEELWPQLLARSPYISSEKITRHRYNAEGLLRSTTESTREFSGVMTVDGVNGKQLVLLYQDSAQTEKFLPYGEGRYWPEIEGYTMIDTPIYEGSADTAAEPVGIMPVRKPYSKKGPPSDGPPPSVSMPLPTCKEVDTCLMEAQREYSRDMADWQARQANGVSARVHSVRFNCLKLNLKRGQLYGGGLITSLSHRFSTKNPGSTDIKVVVAHG